MWQTALTAPLFPRAGWEKRYWFEKCPLPVVWQVGVQGCQTEKSLGSVRIHSQAKVEITPLPSSGPEWLRSGDRFKVQGPASGPGRLSIVHRSSRFVFLISPSRVPAGHPDSRQPTPRGIFFLFLNRGRPIWGSDLQRHPTSSLDRKRQAQDKSAGGIGLLHNPNSPGHWGRGDVGNATPAWLGLC